MDLEKRHFLRNNIEPLEISVDEIRCNKGIFQNVSLLIDEVSYEGIRFTSSLDFDVYDTIEFCLPSLIPEPLISGEIKWKKEMKEADRFQYGVYISRQL